MSHDATTFESFNSLGRGSSDRVSSENSVILETTYKKFISTNPRAIVSKYSFVQFLMLVVFLFSVMQIYSFLTGQRFLLHPLLSLITLLGSFFVLLTAYLASRIPKK